MEKLLELLQIYVIERQGREQFKLHGDKIILWRPYKLRRFPQYDTNAVIISKRFGFIQRLVEKDKIDIDAYKTVYSGDLDKRKTLVESRDGEEIYQVTEHGVYESLLMLLAIQDDPIDFLISILR